MLVRSVPWSLVLLFGTFCLPSLIEAWADGDTFLILGVCMCIVLNEVVGTMFVVAMRRACRADVGQGRNAAAEPVARAALPRPARPGLAAPSQCSSGSRGSARQGGRFYRREGYMCLC